jgi:putative CocE/NonD family hydrolase
VLLQWFDQYLKGMDNKVETLPNVTQYVAGYSEDGKPRYASSTDWPHPQADAQRWYLHGDQSLSVAAPVAGENSHTIKEPEAPEVTVGASADGTLLEMSAVSHDSSKHSISYDQWTLGLAGIIPKKYYSDDTDVEKAQKAVTFDTTPMTSDFYINGPIEADVWMSTNVGAAALSVRVDDVSADGKTITPLANGLLAAAYRAVDTTRSRYLQGEMIQPWHPFTEASMLPVKKNEPMLLPVEIFPAAALIRAGHSLRIAVSSSNQSQGGWSLPMQKLADKGVTTIYNDTDHPSSVVLPVVPASVLN